MSEIDDSQINPIFLQQLQDALESDHEEADSSRLGNEDQLLFDSLRSIISGDSTEAHQQQNWNQMLDGNPDPNTLEAVQTALRELGGGDAHAGSAWGGQPLTEEDRDRIRNDNRARKRKWRDTNVTRNRDHDLRSRIVRRANIMFGEREVEEKHRWIEDEFHRRKERRFMKDPTDFSRMFSSSNQTLDPGSMVPQVHAPRPPAFFSKIRPPPSVRLPVRIASVEACMLGRPLDLMARAKQMEAPRPPPARTAEAKPKKPLFEKFGLPALPKDLAKLGPMPPLPKSILDHQRKEREKKKVEVEAEAEAEAEVEVEAQAETQPQAEPQVQAQPPATEQPAPQPAPEHPPTPQPLNDEELENIDDMLGNALDALGQQHEADTDPTRAIEELQAALAGQGLFE